MIINFFDTLDTLDTLGNLLKGIKGLIISRVSNTTKHDPLALFAVKRHHPGMDWQGLATLAPGLLSSLHILIR